MTDIDILKFGSSPLVNRISDPLMHLSPNSMAAVRHEIQKQERIHWTSGLRQSELSIRNQLTTLHQNQAQARAFNRKMRLLVFEREELLGRSDSLTFPETIRLEEIDDLISVAKREWCDTLPLIRDAEMQLQAAEEEKIRIVKDHPEAEGLTYGEIQERYTEVALLSKLSCFFAAEAWASMNHLPSSVGHLVLDVAPHQRETLMRLEAEIRTSVCLDEATVQAARRIAELPPEEQKVVINMIMPSGN